MGRRVGWLTIDVSLRKRPGKRERARPFSQQRWRRWLLKPLGTWATLRDSILYVTNLLLTMTVELCADTEAQRFSKLTPERALPIYTVDEPGCGLDHRMVAAVTVPLAVPEQLLRRLLPTPVVPASPPEPVPIELESLL